jgi:hypothetical protein
VTPAGKAVIVFWNVGSRRGKPPLAGPVLTREKDQQRVSLLRLRRHVLAEEIVGIFIAAIVSVLGIIEPAAG